jgi:hypothetical protein
MGSALGTRGKPSKTSSSSRPAYIPLKQPAASENTSLRALLESHCPSVLSPFRPNWWLFKRVDTFFSRCYVLTQHSGHLQTLYSVFGDFSAVDPVAYDRQVLSPLHQSSTHIHLRRQLLQLKDGGTLSGYLFQSSGAPLIVTTEALILHRLLRTVSSRMKHRSL